MSETQKFLIGIKEGKQIDISSLNLKDELNPEIWLSEDILNPEISERLYQIAIDFLKNLDMPDVKIYDIVLTGSLANYNWSAYSDLDLHILLDFSEIDENFKLVRDLFNSKHSSWNRAHDITLKGYDVEIYVQDINEPHISSGFYSIMESEWIRKPAREDFEVDWDYVYMKAQTIMRGIDQIGAMFTTGDYKMAFICASRFKDKLKRFRQCGLEKSGQYSAENLVFKLLRRNEYIGKLMSLKTESYDKMMSVNESSTKMTNEGAVKSWRSFLSEVEKKDSDAYEVTLRVSISKKTGPSKHETYSRIRAVPGVTTVHVVPRQQPMQSEIELETLEIRFCCTKEAAVSPSYYVKEILRPAISSIPGVNVVRYSGKVEKI